MEVAGKEVEERSKAAMERVAAEWCRAAMAVAVAALAVVVVWSKAEEQPKAASAVGEMEFQKDRSRMNGTAWYPQPKLVVSALRLN